LLATYVIKYIQTILQTRVSVCRKCRFMIQRNRLIYLLSFRNAKLNFCDLLAFGGRNFHRYLFKSSTDTISVPALSRLIKQMYDSLRELLFIHYASSQTPWTHLRKSETANCLKLEKAWVTHHVNGFACKQTPIEICRNIVNKTCPRLSCLWKVFWSRVQSTNRLAWHTFLANVLTKEETKAAKIIVGL